MNTQFNHHSAVQASLNLETEQVCREQLNNTENKSAAISAYRRLNKKATRSAKASSKLSFLQFAHKAAQAPAKNAVQNSKKRWLCNVSEGVKFSKGVQGAINIASCTKFSQYELMVKLLKAETCDVIYFDCQLSASQIGILKMLQVFSNTELVHARLAMQFSQNTEQAVG